jgi:hypothetical protein
MPNGIFPIPEFKTTPAYEARPGLTVRIKTRWRRNRLDDELAHGADSRATAALALRAAQLRSDGERGRIANALVEAVGEAGRGTPVTIKPRPHRAEVLARGEELLALAERLRADLPLEVRGAAMASRLVSDRKGPLHRKTEQDLRTAIESARDAMDTRREIARDLRSAA